MAIKVKLTCGIVQHFVPFINASLAVTDVTSRNRRLTNFVKLPSSQPQISYLTATSMRRSTFLQPPCRSFSSSLMCAVSLAEYFTTFRKDSLPSSSETSTLLLAPEDKGITNIVSLQLFVPAVQRTSEKTTIFTHLSLSPPYQFRESK